MTTKINTKEPKAVLEARAWKKKVSDLILDKGWAAFMRQSEAATARWTKDINLHAKSAK